MNIIKRNEKYKLCSVKWTENISDIKTEAINRAEDIFIDLGTEKSFRFFDLLFKKKKNNVIILNIKISCNLNGQ